MRRKGRKETCKNGKLVLSDLANLVDGVESSHHCRNCGVELHSINIVGYLLDKLMDVLFKCGSEALALDDVEKVIESLKEALTALDGLSVPGGGLLEVADEHLVKTHSICAVISDDIIGINYVTAGLGHLFAILTKDHTVAGTLKVGLVVRKGVDVVKELGPESGVKKVKGGMLHTAVIPIYGHPIFKRLARCELLIVVRIAISEEVPGRACPLRHSISLALCGAVTLRTRAIYPIGHK